MDTNDLGALPTARAGHEPSPSVSAVPVTIANAELDAWLAENCGRGLPHGEVTDLAGALHALAYVHRQIARTSSYKVHIGQCVSAETGLLWALRYFAAQAIETRRAETERLRAQHESAVPEACAQPEPGT